MRLSNAIVLVNCLRAPLSTCFYQIVICQISFEIHLSSQKKSTGHFPLLIDFSIEIVFSFRGIMLKVTTRGYCMIHAKRIYQNAKNQQIVLCSKHKKFIVDDKETTDQTHILECIKEFYETLFKKTQMKTRDKN